MRKISGTTTTAQTQSRQFIRYHTVWRREQRQNRTPIFSYSRAAQLFSVMMTFGVKGEKT